MQVARRAGTAPRPGCRVIRLSSSEASTPGRPGTAPRAPARCGTRRRTRRRIGAAARTPPGRRQQRPSVDCGIVMHRGEQRPHAVARPAAGQQRPGSGPAPARRARPAGDRPRVPRKPHSAWNSVSAQISSGLCAAVPVVAVRRRDSGMPAASSRANPRAACAGDGWACRRQRLGGGQHLEQERQPGPTTSRRGSAPSSASGSARSPVEQRAAAAVVTDEARRGRPGARRATAPPGVRCGLGSPSSSAIAVRDPQAYGRTRLCINSTTVSALSRSASGGSWSATEVGMRDAGL